MRTDHMRTYPKMTRTASSAVLVLIGVLALYNWVLGPHVHYLLAMQRLQTAVASVAANGVSLGLGVLLQSLIY